MPLVSVFASQSSVRALAVPSTRSQRASSAVEGAQFYAKLLNGQPFVFDEMPRRVLDPPASHGACCLSEVIHLIVFRLDERRYALPLRVVERFVRAVEVTPLPKAPAVVLGAINVHGRVLPVLNVRRRFLMPDREITPADWFLVAHTSRHTVVLVVDESEGLLERSQAEIVLSTQIVPGLEQFPGVVRLDDGLVFIHDLERFLSLEEANALDEAMDETPET